MAMRMAIGQVGSSLLVRGAKVMSFSTRRKIRDNIYYENTIDDKLGGYNERYYLKLPGFLSDEPHPPFPKPGQKLPFHPSIIMQAINAISKHNKSENTNLELVEVKDSYGYTNPIREYMVITVCDHNDGDRTKDYKVALSYPFEIDEFQLLDQASIAKCTHEVKKSNSRGKKKCHCAGNGNA